MSSAAAKAKLAEIKAKRERWLAERDAERLRADVTQEMEEQAGGSSSHTVYNSQNYTDSFTTATTSRSTAQYEQDDPSRRLGRLVRDGEVLDRITQRISERMRDEVRAELQAEMSKDAQREAKEMDRDESVLQSYLASEIESHACPICYDVMLPPDRSPMLLFPCGHTFCEECLNRQKHTAYAHRCPYCKKKIESKAVNFSLQQLVQAYVSKRDSIAKSRESKPVPPAASDDVVTPDMSQAEQIESYQKQYRTLDVRCRVLENEAQATIDELHLLDEKEDAAKIVLHTLQAEEAEVKDRLESIMKELEFVEEQVAKQAAKFEAIATARVEAKQRHEVVTTTLESLQREKDKSVIILEGFNAAVPR